MICMETMLRGSHRLSCELKGHLPRPRHLTGPEGEVWRCRGPLEGAGVGCVTWEAPVTGHKGQVVGSH